MTVNFQSDRALGGAAVRLSKVEPADHPAQGKIPGKIQGKIQGKASTTGEGGAAIFRALRRWRRVGWRTPLTRRILLVNILVLLIPVLGLLHLDQYRQTLVDSDLEAMNLQGRALSLSLGSTAVVVDRAGEERLLPEMTRHLMRVLLSGTGVRARVFALEGELLADSFLLSGPGGFVQVVELPPPDDGSLTGRVGRFYDRIVDWIPGIGDLLLYQEAAVQRAGHYPEVAGALAGYGGGMLRADSQGRLVLSMAIPVQRYRKVLGALLLSKGGDEITAAVYDRRLDILYVFAVALAATVLWSVYLAGTLARPIRRLAHAAVLVRFSRGRRIQIPDFTHRNDEIGDLSGALREMTEALWSRLDAIESFAADVAHEIKNPLTSLRSAVETVARVDDPEQQKKLMQIILDDVQRLDRLISDISDASRLDAELSRAESGPVDLKHLLVTLTGIIGPTLPEEGPKLVLDVPSHQDFFVSGMEVRLGQVFRNLLGNAASFSPPGGTIRLSARKSRGWIEVWVEDQGPGLPEGKLEAVFDRFYSERPKSEKFGTHSGLGLSISRQVVEAHGGTIHAENLTDKASRRVRGARFVVRLPAPKDAGP